MNHDYFCMHWHFFPITELTVVLLSSKDFTPTLQLCSVDIWFDTAGVIPTTHNKKTKMHIRFHHVRGGSGTCFGLKIPI